MTLSRVRGALLVPFVLLALTLAALLAGCGGSDELGGTGTPASASDLVTLRGPGFTIGLPTKATSQTQTVKTQAGPIKATYYSSESEEGAFVVALTDLPANVEPNLDGAVDGAVKQVDGTLKEKSEIELLGYPARAARYLARAGGEDVTFFARVVAVKGKLFQVQFVVTGEDVAEPPAVFEDVLDSIDLD